METNLVFWNYFTWNFFPLVNKNLQGSWFTDSMGKGNNRREYVVP